MGLYKTEICMILIWGEGRKVFITFVRISPTSTISWPYLYLVLGRFSRMWWRVPKEATLTLTLAQNLIRVSICGVMQCQLRLLWGKCLFRGRASQVTCVQEDSHGRGCPKSKLEQPLRHRWSSDLKEPIPSQRSRSRFRL